MTTCAANHYESRFLGLAEHLRVGLFLEGLEGRANYSNRCFGSMFGLESFDGAKSIGSIMKQNLIETSLPELFNLNAGDEPIHLKTLDARTLSVEIVSLPTEGGLLERLWIFNDVSTEAKADMLLAQQRAQITESAKLRALGEMAGGIAHEINNPLAIIQSRAGLLKDRALHNEASASFVVENSEKIDAVVVRISKIVKGLRAFARDDEGEAFREVIVAELLDDTLSFCREKIKNHGIQMTLSPLPSDLCLHCRPTQISQVLLNLLINAFDAVDGLTDKWIRIDISATSTEIEIGVMDSGKGISSELRERIFEPFFTTKETGKGTGLGLSLSRGIVEAHGGKIDVDSSAAHTRFRIRLPLKRA